MKTVLVSGGFDPLHTGHLKLLKEAAKLGRLVVALNSNEWLIRKKGYCFLDFTQRKELLEAYPFVSKVISFNDDDNTALKALEIIKPDIFANGGDKNNQNIPEASYCQENNISIIDKVGGDNKTTSSSDLVKKAMEQLSRD